MFEVIDSIPSKISDNKEVKMMVNYLHQATKTI